MIRKLYKLSFCLVLTIRIMRISSKIRKKFRRICNWKIDPRIFHICELISEKKIIDHFLSFFPNNSCVKQDMSFTLVRKFLSFLSIVQIPCSNHLVFARSMSETSYYSAVPVRAGLSSAQRKSSRPGHDSKSCAF